MSEFIQSACPHDCPSTCALEVERLDAKSIGRVRGAENPYTDGVICAKVARYAERVHHPARLMRPLRRVGPKGSGRFEAIGWDEALDRTAEAFLAAEAKYGAQTLWPYYYAGTMGLLQRDGIERLRRAKGYSGMLRTICSSTAREGWRAGCGAVRGVNPLEMAHADLIVFWGNNAVATQVNAWRHATAARRNRGAKIVCIDPYRNRTAQGADLHLALRPGSDGALAVAVMHVLVNEGFANRDYLARHTDFSAEFEAHLATRTPAWAAGITGLTEQEICRFARLYGGTQRSYIRAGYGFTRTRNGAVNMHAVSCLPAVTGAWQHEGGGALFANADIFGIDKTLIEGLDIPFESRMLDMSEIGAVLTGEADALRGGPPVTGILLQNTNPAMVAPESAKVHAGLARDDLFLCAHEQFLTETANYADIVLPATTFLEHEDLYAGGGHSYLQVTKAVIEAPGECRSNHEVLCALASRLGAGHRGFEMSAWEIVDETLRASGKPDAETLYRQRWFDCSPDADTAHYRNGFAHADQRFHFEPAWVGPYGRAGMPRFPDFWAATEAGDREHPFRLVTAPAHNFLNSSFTETSTSRKLSGRPTAYLHPEDCLELDISNGDRIRLGNRRGSVLLHADARQGQQRGVVVVESIWPNGSFEEGIGINVLIGADPVRPAGGAAFHDAAVWIRPEPAPH